MKKEELIRLNILKAGNQAPALQAGLDEGILSFSLPIIGSIGNP